ncbi:hypothetical protein AB0N28_07040 [Streptomyces sp. NPDC051130]|uniref:hypothetical protein n=1 Tax=Streptomyces sp. NPDC051130 TaxID=3157223 RepID=UPI00341A70F7
MTTSALADLDAQLDSDDTLTILSAVWDVFTVVTKVADAITFDEGSDELQAMSVARQCMAGRDLLPLPQSGSPVNLPAPARGAAGLDPYVQLLEHAQQSLIRLTATADRIGEGAKLSLSEATKMASRAAVALAAVRER